MKIWAIADLHLAISTPEKDMSVFGSSWEHYMERIFNNWKAVVSENDLVLIAGDISWARELDQASIDLNWIDQLPGKKIMIEGNHDHWWVTESKLSTILPKSIQGLYRRPILIDDKIAICGTRLWDSLEFNYNESIDWKPEKGLPSPQDPQLQEKIFNRELKRLEASLDLIPKDISVKVVMTHYPPIGPDMSDSLVSKLLEKYQVQHVIFGHLHQLKSDFKGFSKKNNVNYHFVAGDWVNFTPQYICEG